MILTKHNKTLFNFLGLMVIFSSQITSCNEDELELDPNICKITVKSEGTMSNIVYIPCYRNTLHTETHRQTNDLF